jgi:phage terminase large subunit
MRVGIKMPRPLYPVFQGKARYRCAYGGRGSGKSYNFAMMLALRGYEQPLRILCCREIQISLEESSMAEVKDAINSVPFLKAHYEMGEKFIRGKNGTKFVFRGLHRNTDSLKSMAKIDICWVEEAESVSKASWDKLKPTIRKPGSEIWVTWNPERDDAPCQEMFVKNPDSNMKVAKLNWEDNPWFPPELEYERQACLRLDPDNYPHIWEGECQTRVDAQIFNGKWVVEEFEPDPKVWTGPAYGLDFGFSQDPTACVQAWKLGDMVYVYREAGAIRLELDDTPRYLIESMPNIENHPVRCDNARPESISYIKGHGIPLARPVLKWQGSVEDGIQWLRSHRKIVIHPRCKNLIKEMRLYSYKIDKMTGDPTRNIVDANNHYIDALRYAFEPLIKRRGHSLEQLDKLDRTTIGF